MEIINQPLAVRLAEGCGLEPGDSRGLQSISEEAWELGAPCWQDIGQWGTSVSPVEGALPCIQQSVPYTIFSALQTENLGIILHLSLYILS